MSERVTTLLANNVRAAGHTVHVLDPKEYPDLQTLTVPRHYNPTPTPGQQAVHEHLLASDAFILIASEYNHSFSGTLKNFLDNFMPEYARKPFGIVSYSDGPFGGVRASEALRIVISTLQGVSIPTGLLYPRVQDAITEQGALVSAEGQGRIDRFVAELVWYAQALRNAR